MATYLALHALQIQHASFGTGKMPFPYAPAFLLVVTPFALLPFKVGIIAWSLATIAVFAVVARRLFHTAGWLPVALPAVITARNTSMCRWVMRWASAGSVMGKAYPY